jgi:hypothetical protein
MLCLSELFLFLADFIVTAPKWHGICLYHIDAKCPQNHCAVENQVKERAR